MEASTDSHLIINVLDVGHGDSILIEFPDGKSYGIVDSNWGNTPSTKNLSSTKLLWRLKSKGLRPPSARIEFIANSHPHADHYSGLADTIHFLLKEKITIKEYWDFGASARKAKALLEIARFPEQEARLAELVKLCKARKLLGSVGTTYRILASPIDALWSGQGVTIDLIAPSAEHFESYINYLSIPPEERSIFLQENPGVCNDNMVCSALQIRYGGTTILLTADLTNKAWDKILARSLRTQNPISCNILKVSHHGSRDGSFPRPNSPLCKQFAASDRPLVALISGGYRPNLPHSKTIDSLKAHNSQIYCTGQPDFSGKQYRPKGLDQDLFHLLEAAEMEELDEGTKSGHGDIRVNISSNGQFTVKTEHAKAVL